MRRLVLLLAILSLLAVPAGAEPDPVEEHQPELPTEEVYFLCEGETPVQNVENAEGRFATWGPEAPTESVTAGAGCGAADSPFMQSAVGNLYDASWEGTFTGTLDSVTLHLHNIYAGPARMDETFQLKVRLFANGRQLGGEDGLDVAVTPVRSDTGASELIELTIEGIGLTAERDETKKHLLGLVVHGGTRRSPEDQINVTDTLSAWVWGTTEVPAGLTFNPTEPAEVVIGE